MLWYRRFKCWILLHDIPLHSLIKTTLQQLMYITDYTGRYELASDISVQVWNGWRLCQSLIVNLQKSGIDIRQWSFPNDRQYIILQQ